MEKVILRNIKETDKFAKMFAKLLKGGDIVLLGGDLGAGKTTFTKCVLRHLGVKDEVTSPTFTIMKEYKSKKFNIYHFDMYRLESGVEAREFGLEEYLYAGDGNSLVFVEWAENIKDILSGRFIWVNISIVDGDKRQFEIIRG